MAMKTEEFDYKLPRGLIAQQPENERASSRLLVLNRRNGVMVHTHFFHITNYLRKGDLLVLNDSKVFPARLRAVKKTGGALDVLLVNNLTGTRWLCLVRGLKKTAGRTTISIGKKEADIFWDENEACWVVEFYSDRDCFDIVKESGTMPLPPYIKRSSGSTENDFERYQTVYAQSLGSIAAPTAGFHFTKNLLVDLINMGIEIVKITLHIGIGTFALIKSETVEDHCMHREFYTITPETKEAIIRAKSEGRRVVACGTSATRTLETIGSLNGCTPLEGYTDIFIYPGYRFKIIDALITNFHLPRSTPLMLATAFAGKERIRESYMAAMERGYRFYSYGDAMLVV